MRKNFSVTLFALSLSSLLLCSCNGSSKGSSSQSYNGRVFDISEKQDGSLTATSELKSGYYSLTISGEGNAIDYDNEKQVPWYPITKKVNKVAIDRGINNIGDYYFYSIAVDYVILPSTVLCVGENSFNSKTTVYTYGAEITNIDNDVYYYSETKPEVSGKYFYMVDGEPHIWIFETQKFLFIGNSFTYRQGTVDAPAVPLNLQKIAINLGYDVEVDYVVQGSHSLTKFADPTDEKGAIVEQKLTTNQYNYIILQEQSTTPLNNYSTFLAAVKKLQTRINQTQNNAKIYLYETWGYESGLSTTYPTIASMEAAIRDAYTSAGSATGIPVNYVGKTFTYVYENMSSSISIYNEDKHHQSEYGAYLSAAVHFRSIFNVKVSGCTEYTGLDETKCKALLGVADTLI